MGRGGDWCEIKAQLTVSCPPFHSICLKMVISTHYIFATLVNLNGTSPSFHLLHSVYFYFYNLLFSTSFLFTYSLFFFVLIVTPSLSSSIDLFFDFCTALNHSSFLLFLTFFIPIFFIILDFDVTIANHLFPTESLFSCSIWLLGLAWPDLAAIYPKIYLPYPPPCPSSRYCHIIT